MLIAVAAMFLQQTCGSVGRVLPAVLAPLIILELHADPSWVGVYFGLTAIAALIGQLGSGGFIIRHGAIRMSQVALLSTGGGMAVAIIGGAAGFVLSALVGNCIAAVATPASSQLLGRWAIRRYAPFAFSVTQTAIPAGILLGGWLGPPLAQSLGWRGTMLVSAGACWFFVLLLQPLHGRLDTDAVPTHAIQLSDFRTTITSVLAVRELRALSFACFAFNGLQAVFIAYFVTYLTALGYNLVAAGVLFSTVIAIAIPCRILWGWVGSFYVAPRFVMSWLAFGMAASVVLMGIHRSLARSRHRGGKRRAQRHRDVVARHSAVGVRAPCAIRPGGRGHRRRAVVRPDGRVSVSVGIFPAAARDRGLFGRLGCLRHSGGAGRYKFAASGDRRSTAVGMKVAGCGSSARAGTSWVTDSIPMYVS